MRTKLGLLTVALIAAGALPTMAQSNVYSVNVVGYVNITTRPGFNLLANQLTLNPTTNSIATILNTSAAPGSLQDCQVLKYNKVAANYSLDIFDGTGFFGPPGWYDGNTGLPSDRSLNPGEGFFFYNSQSTNVTLTLAGSVPQGSSSVPLTAGFNLVGTVAPVSIPLDQTLTNNFPGVQDMQYLAFTNTPAGANYTVPDIYDASGFFGPPGWYNGNTGNPETPIPAVGQGYFIYTPSGTNWTRTFNVN
jgi:hypothetical protein